MFHDIQSSPGNHTPRPPSWQLLPVSLNLHEQKISCVFNEKRPDELQSLNSLCRIIQVLCRDYSSPNSLYCALPPTLSPLTAALFFKDELLCDLLQESLGKRRVHKHPRLHKQKASNRM